MRERHGEMLLWLAKPLAIGLVLGALGPFGTYGAHPAVERIAFWCAVVLANWLIMDGTLRALDRRFRDRSPLVAFSLPLGAALLALGPCLLVVLGAGRAILGVDFAVRPWNLAWQVLLLLWFVGAVAYAVERLRSRLADQSAAEAAPTSTDPTITGGGAGTPDPVASFRTRWPAGLTGRLLALEMEDHYLRVHTDAGSDLILCRMRDAARELAAADGMRVHRSYWVAREAVTGVERKAHRPVLVLENGLHVPVGRTHIAPLRAAGWLDPPAGTARGRISSGSG